MNGDEFSDAGPNAEATNGTIFFSVHYVCVLLQPIVCRFACYEQESPAELFGPSPLRGNRCTSNARGTEREIMAIAEHDGVCCQPLVRSKKVLMRYLMQSS